ncbi:MAG: hypothetical protein A2X57_11365 [Nitrospirae bacterium GWD2_57_8]|jgi:hypothetical protein|nr:MAG: hypothetical protein A2X57_11365 [Nitrospirae bacterium GWD2_57_8]
MGSTGLDIKKDGDDLFDHYSVNGVNAYLLTSLSISKIRPLIPQRYNPKAETWMLYWIDRNSKWHEDEGLAPVKNLDRIIAELDRDPTGIYWG